MPETQELTDVTFSAEHADLYRNGEDELMVHVIVADLDKLIKDLQDYKKVKEDAKAAEQSAPAEG